MCYNTQYAIRNTEVCNAKKSVIGALVLIALGVWLLAQNLRLPLPPLGTWWPAILILTGMVALVNYVSGRERTPGQIFLGFAATLLGLFFCLFTLNVPVPLPGLREGVRWEDMGRLWPAFVLIGGVAVIAQFIVNPRRAWGDFVFGALAVIVGFVAFPFTLGMLPPGWGRAVLKLWPLMLIVMGLALLLQAALRRRA